MAPNLALSSKKELFKDKVALQVKTYSFLKLCEVLSKPNLY
jgi:hypothetical protein